jgi:hypothetical protein
MGALILILGRMNRAEGVERVRLRALYLYVGGMILVCLTVLLMELTYRSLMHTMHFFHLLAIVAPLVLAAMARGSRYRWAATTVAGVYSSFVLLMGWILPLFPAQPKLGPVYQHVTQFTPPEFPMLLIVPALVLDLLWQRTANWGVWRQSLLSGTVFLAVFAAVPWPFADFLMSPWARNWFFGAKCSELFCVANSFAMCTIDFSPPRKAPCSGRNSDWRWPALLTTRRALPPVTGCSASAIACDKT